MRPWAVRPAAVDCAFSCRDAAWMLPSDVVDKMKALDLVSRFSWYSFT